MAALMRDSWNMFFGIYSFTSGGWKLLCYEVMPVLFVKWKPALSTRRRALSNLPWLNFWLPTEWQPTKRECIYMNPKPSVISQNTIRNVHGGGLGQETSWLQGFFCWRILCYCHSLPWTWDHNQHCNTQSFKQWLRRFWKHKNIFLNLCTAHFYNVKILLPTNALLSNI